MHSMHHARETIDLPHQETQDFILPDLWHPNIPDLNPVNYKIWVIMQHLVYQSVAWMRRLVWPEQSTIDIAIDHCKTSSVHPFDFERRTIQTQLTLLILSVSVTFSVTFVWLLLYYIFPSKNVPATSTIRPTSVFVLPGNAAAKSGYGGTFYSMLGYRYLLSDMLKKILKSDSNCQVTAITLRLS